MANTIDFNVNTNAVTVLNQTANAAENTAKGFTSAKAELRALQNQMLEMDQTSDAFKKASTRAAQLKDTIGDLSAEINANAGNAFESLSNNVGLFGSRLMNLDLKGAGQALRGMGSAVSKIDFKTLKEEIGGLVSGFGTLAKAILANPILLLVSAVALIAMNFDKIIKMFPAIENGLRGINDEQRAIAKSAQAQADASKKAYENSSLIENSLRLQGKSEKEILQIKMKKLETSIKDGWVNLQIQEQQAQAQIDAAKRNGELLQLIIKAGLTNATLGLRLLAAPIDLVLAAANKVSEALGFGTVIAFNINEEISKLINKGSELASGLIFDPAAQEKELKDTFDKQRHDLEVAQNDYNGYVIAINQIDKKASDDKKAANQTAEEARQKELEANAIKAAEELKQNQKLAEEKLKIQEEYIKASQGAQANELYELEKKKELELQTWEGAEEEKVLIIEKYRLLEEEINQKYDDAALAKQLEENEKKKAADEKAAEEAKTAKQKELDELAKAEEAKAQLRIDAAKTSLSIIGDLAEAFAGKSEAQQKKAFQIQKGVSIATATIDTYLAAQGAYRSQMAISTPDAPVRAAIAAGIAIAQGLARVAIISKQQFQGTGGTSGGGGGGSVPSAGGMQAPSPANFNFLGNQPNQQPPLQAYVVGTQVSSNLEAQQLIQNQSRLGG
jgi:hypothetical protein